MQGVCYGLKELLDNITRQQLAENLGRLLPTVQSALVDPDPGVRQVPCFLKIGMACNFLYLLQFQAVSSLLCCQTNLTWGVFLAGCSLSIQHPL